MHALPTPAPRRSYRTGLDALVLEEIEALRTSALPARQPHRGPSAGYASDEQFLAAALRYLASHPDPAALVARLAAGFAPRSFGEAAAAGEVGEGAAAAAPDEAAEDAPPDTPATEGEEQRP